MKSTTIGYLIFFIGFLVIMVDIFIFNNSNGSNPFQWAFSILCAGFSSLFFSFKNYENKN